MKPGDYPILEAIALAGAYVVDAISIYGAIAIFGLMPLYLYGWAHQRKAWDFRSWPSLISLAAALILSLLLSGFFFIIGMALCMWGC